MVLGGLWHGAGITFVIWGAWQGAGLVVNRWWTQNVRHTRDPGAAGAARLGRHLPVRPGRLGLLPRHVALGRGHLPQADGDAQPPDPAEGIPAVIPLLLLVLVVGQWTGWVPLVRRYLPEGSPQRYLAYGTGLAVAVMLVPAQTISFIYFQF